MPKSLRARIADAQEAVDSILCLVDDEIGERGGGSDLDADSADKVSALAGKAMRALRRAYDLAALGEADRDEVEELLLMIEGAMTPAEGTAELFRRYHLAPKEDDRD